MIYAYTSIADGWDNLRPPEVVSHSENVRYVCFTNTPNLPKVLPWEYRPLLDVGSSSRTSRLPKIVPHLMLPADAEYSIYHDGNFQLKKLPEQIVDETLRSCDWAAHKHPARNCVYEEGEILLKEGIGTRHLVTAQIAGYRKEGYPAGAGLWANGFIVRRHTDIVRQLCEAWWKEFCRGCERDQMSFPVIRHGFDLAVNTINEPVYQSSFLNFWWHAAWKDRPCNWPFIGQRTLVNAAIEKIKDLTGRYEFDYPIYN